MESSSLEEENIMKDVRNIFRLEKLSYIVSPDLLKNKKNNNKSH